MASNTTHLISDMEVQGSKRDEMLKRDNCVMLLELL
jgi:hypothetical protein